MSGITRRVEKAFVEFWSWLRAVTEDAAYDRYLASTNVEDARANLTREKFYLARLEQKYSRPCRCC